MAPNHTKGGLARWQACYELAAVRGDPPTWRGALARALREAVGCTYVTVHGGTPVAAEQATWPEDHGPFMDHLRASFLPRIMAAGEGPAFALAHFGRVYTPLEVSRHTQLAADMRAYLADADVRGYCVTLLGAGMDGLVVIGDAGGSAALLERAGAGLLGLAALASRGRVGAGAMRRLTPREREIAALLVEGFTSLNVARRLDIAEQTVSVHVRRIYRKLGVHSRVELARALAAPQA